MPSELPIDIDKWAAHGHTYELSVSGESAEDAAARRLRETAEALLKRRMTFALFLFSLVLVAVVFIGCILLFAYGSADDKKWAAGIVSAIVSGLIGYLVGQSRK